MQMSGVELSIVDPAPQELLLVTVQGMALEYHSAVCGSGAGGVVQQQGAAAGQRYTQALARIRNVQVSSCLL